MATAFSQPLYNIIILLKIRPLILLVVVLMIGCNKDDDTVIKSDIVVDFQDREYGIVLNCWTVKIYPCISYQIDYNLSLKKNSIDVKFMDIIVPQECFDSLEPAEAQILIGNITQAKRIFKFKLNGETTEIEVLNGKGSTARVVKQGKVWLNQ